MQGTQRRRILCDSYNRSSTILPFPVAMGKGLGDGAETCSPSLWQWGRGRGMGRKPRLSWVDGIGRIAMRPYTLRCGGQQSVVDGRWGGNLLPAPVHWGRGETHKNAEIRNPSKSLRLCVPCASASKPPCRFTRQMLARYPARPFLVRGRGTLREPAAARDRIPN